MTSRWFHGYRVGQRVEALLYLPAGSCWFAAVVRRKTRAGYPVVTDGRLEWVVDRKGNIRPVRLMPAEPEPEPEPELLRGPDEPLDPVEDHYDTTDEMHGD